MAVAGKEHFCFRCSLEWFDEMRLYSAVIRHYRAVREWSMMAAHNDGLYSIVALILFQPCPIPLILSINEVAAHFVEIGIKQNDRNGAELHRIPQLPVQVRKPSEEVIESFSIVPEILVIAR